jgi:hypothetical protein
VPISYVINIFPLQEKIFGPKRNRLRRHSGRSPTRGSAQHELDIPVNDSGYQNQHQHYNDAYQSLHHNYLFLTSIERQRENSNLLAERNWSLYGLILRSTTIKPVCRVLCDSLTRRSRPTLLSGSVGQRSRLAVGGERRRTHWSSTVHSRRLREIEIARRVTDTAGSRI